MRNAGYIALLLSAGCAVAKPQVASDVPLVVGVTPAAPKGASPPGDGRPAGVAAWIRAERTDTLLGLLDLGNLASALPSIDLGQDADVVLTTTADAASAQDLVPVVRFHVRDAKALVALAEQTLDVREEGNQILARRRGAVADDQLACALSHIDTVVCSTIDGMRRYGDWLADVQPPPGRAAQLTIYGADAARRILADDAGLGPLPTGLETSTVDLGASPAASSAWLKKLADAVTAHGLRAQRKPTFGFAASTGVATAATDVTALLSPSL